MRNIKLTDAEAGAVERLIKDRRDTAQYEVKKIEDFDRQIEAGTAPEVLIARRPNMQTTLERCRKEAVGWEELRQKFLGSN